MRNCYVENETCLAVLLNVKTKYALTFQFGNIEV